MMFEIAAALFWFIVIFFLIAIIVISHRPELIPAGADQRTMVVQTVGT
jgi:hypothetical protein